MRHYEEKDSVKNRVIPGRSKSATAEEKQLDVAQSFVENLYENLRKVGRQHDISTISVQRIMKQIRFYLYKIHFVQELSEDDFDRRLEFCEIMMERIDADPNFVFNIAYSNEATFQMNIIINRHNCRFWSDINQIGC